MPACALFNTAGTKWQQARECSTDTSACRQLVYSKYTSACLHLVYSKYTSACLHLVYLCSPKEDFGRSNKPVRMRFPGKHFSKFRRPNRVLTPLKSASKRILKGSFDLSKSSFGEHRIYSTDTSACRNRVVSSTVTWHAVILWPMWETAFARNSHAGLGRPVYEPNICVSMGRSS